MKLHQALDAIQQSALDAVDPRKAVLNFLRRENDHLSIDGQSYPLSDRRVFLVGAGKAAVPMAQAVETILGDQLEEGLVIVKYGHVASLQKTLVLEGAHPEPDEAGCKAAQSLLAFLQDKLSPKDLLLVVISGGGSALLPVPVKEITFEEKRETTSLLLQSEASIQEINTIRKHLSQIKGGRLLDYTKGAQLLVLLLSDVVGDDLASIASGPASPDPTTFHQCTEIIQRLGIQEDLPESVRKYLNAGAGNQGPKETPKPGDSRFDRVHNVIVGCNIKALQAAAKKAQALGFTPLILSDSITGNTTESARMHVALARQVLKTGDPLPPPCCLISGGETTVRLTGDGKGGRNQEFALCCAREIADWSHTNLLFSSLGSDGTDGPTDAAGAVASPETAGHAAARGLSVQDYLDRNDSYHFFQEVGGLITTGPTLTNVMDLRFVLIDR
jgi:glycerate 2-kinase